MCWFRGEVIGPHLVLLYSDLLEMCDLSREDTAIGSLASSNISGNISLGVVSAAVGRGDEGWIVTLFDAITSDMNSDDLVEWSFRSGGCWFELQDQLGANQSDLVFKLKFLIM